MPIEPSGLHVGSVRVARGQDAGTGRHRNECGDRSRRHPRRTAGRSRSELGRRADDEAGCATADECRKGHARRARADRSESGAPELEERVRVAAVGTEHKPTAVVAEMAAARSGGCTTRGTSKCGACKSKKIGVRKSGASTRGARWVMQRLPRNVFKSKSVLAVGLRLWACDTMHFCRILVSRGHLEVTIEWKLTSFWCNWRVNLVPYSANAKFDV
jgi:hypothetical protein